MSPEAKKRFFQLGDSLDIVEGSSINELSDLACEARKEILPSLGRARNVNNQWVYLAQIGNKEYQDIEVTLCQNPEQNCINDLDSPRGPKTTLCKQLFSVQKLLALDELGNVNVDTFELPSACICKTVVKEIFNSRLAFRSNADPLDEAQNLTNAEAQNNVTDAAQNRAAAEKDVCNSTNAINHERYGKVGENGSRAWIPMRLIGG